MTTDKRVNAVPVSRRSAVILAVASLGGLMMLVWPLLLRVQPTDRVDPPFLFLALLPIVIAVVLAELSDGGLDTRVLAVLGVLSAAIAILRGLSAGTGGLELVFFLLVLAGRVFGPGFGFVLGIEVPGHTGLSFVPGDPLGENLHRFLAYTLITSTGSFDTGRAITNAVAIVVLGPAVLATLRRAARRVVVVGTVAGAVENSLPGEGGFPTVGTVSRYETREEAEMSAPHSGLRSEAGSQI
jgi:hypothetical protein